MKQSRMFVARLLVAVLLVWNRGPGIVFSDSPAQLLSHESGVRKIVSSATGSGNILSGRYRGYIFPEHGRYRISAQAEFFVAQEQNDEARLNAIFRINLGGHNSHEYVSQIYSHVTSPGDAESVLLKGDNWDLKVSPLRLDGHQLKGTVKSASGHSEGRLILSRVPQYSCLQKSFVEEFKDLKKKRLPVLQTLTGEYQGECEGKNIYLQLEAGKWFEVVPGGHSPMYGYRITGRLAKDSSMCGDSIKRCVTLNFTGGYFNPYTGDLKLKGYPRIKRVKADAGGIWYEGCFLKKRIHLDPSYITRHPWKKNAGQQIFSHSDSSDEALPLRPTPGDLTGHFYGYMYHSELGKYQPLNLDVRSEAYSVSHHQPEKQTFYANAWLYFSEQSEGVRKDYLTFKFREREYLNTTPHMIWDTGLDVRLKISGWTKNTIKGDWISTSYGVVGPFIVVRDPALLKSPDRKDITGVSFGTFREKKWSLELVSLEDRDPEEDALFFPLHIHGTAGVNGLTEVKSVNDGVYDFYTGAVTFALADERVVFGWVGSQAMKLFWPPKPLWGIRMPGMKTRLFHLQAPARWHSQKTNPDEV